MRGFLDSYMERATNLSKNEVEILKNLYLETLKLATDIYGDLIFKPFNKKEHQWGRRPQKAYADAVLVSLSENLFEKEELIKNSKEIIELTKNIFINDERGVMTGRGNTKSDVLDRIALMRSVYKESLE